MFRPDERIDSLLKQDFPDLTVEERDALRHYYGMREISNIFGPKISKGLGYINEGTDFLTPGEDGEQARIDILNNAIALDHKTRGVGMDYHEGLTQDSIANVLNFLTIPPPVTMNRSGMNSNADVDLYDVGPAASKIEDFFKYGVEAQPSGMFGKQKVM